MTERSSAQPQGGSLEADVNKVLDDALEQLRWCQQHAGDRKAGETLRELEAKLGYLAQALSWEMDGESKKARRALGMALGRRRYPQTYYSLDPHDPATWGVDWFSVDH